MHIYFSRIEHYDPGDFIEEETKKEDDENIEKTDNSETKKIII